MNILIPTTSKVMLFILISALWLGFFFPAEVSVDCDAAVGAECTPVLDFIKISEARENPSYIGPNYLYLITQLIIAYIISGAIIKLIEISKKKQA